MTFAKRFYLLLPVVALLGSCEDPGEVPIQARGVVKGTISLLSPYGHSEAVQSGTTVSISGTELSVVTGEDGEFVLDGIPAGTYDFVIEKTGYVTRKVRSIGVLGGQDPLYFNTILMRPSKAVVTDLVISAGENQYEVRGTLHQGDLAEFPFNLSGCVLFIGNSADVSPVKYNSTIVIAPSFDTSEITTLIAARPDQFPSGSTLFAVAYTVGYSYLAYQVNPETGRREYANISEVPSNIAVAEIP